MCVCACMHVHAFLAIPHKYCCMSRSSHLVQVQKHFLGYTVIFKYSSIAKNGKMCSITACLVDHTEKRSERECKFQTTIDLSCARMATRVGMVMLVVEV